MPDPNRRSDPKEARQRLQDHLFDTRSSLSLGPDRSARAAVGVHLPLASLHARTLYSELDLLEVMLAFGPIRLGAFVVKA